MKIQFSVSGTGGWHTVTTIDIGNNPNHPEGIFFDALIDDSRSGYWRAVYSGVPRQFQSAVSTSAFVA